MFIWQRDDPYDTPMAPADHIAREYPTGPLVVGRKPSVPDFAETLVESTCRIVDAHLGGRRPFLTGLIAVQSH